VRYSQNTPSTHSGKLTLGTWILQQPTYRDHGLTEHGREASALQLHLEGPGVFPDLTSHHALSTSRALLPIPLFPISPRHPLSYLLTRPDEPDDGRSIRHK
jgi:hypothetical protein